LSVPPLCIPAIRDLVRHLVAGAFDALARDGRAGRLTAAELRRAMAEYGEAIRANGGGAFIADLPDEAFREPAATTIPIQGEPATWAIDIDLWTGQGRSDLTLSLTARAEAGLVRVAIDDLHPL